jgi:hypothetical protein
MRGGRRVLKIGKTLDKNMQSLVANQVFFASNKIGT